MGYEITRQIRDCGGRRESFFALAQKVFGLSFKEWFENGFWTDRYIPYAICEGDRVVANVAVNRMQFESRGTVRNYVQLGTVMTDPEYRGRGFARQLMETVIKEWEDRCDGIYLFANSDVLDFYPRFGFKESLEYEWRMVRKDSQQDLDSGREAPGPVFRKMDLRKQEDMERFCRCLDAGSPFSALQMRDNLGLVMFYCGDSLKDNIFYFNGQQDGRTCGMVCVGEQEGDTFFCLDFFGREKISLKEAAEAAAPAGTRKIVLGFSLHREQLEMFKSSWEMECVPQKSDVTLFVRGGHDWPDSRRLRFPELSHT